jgi:hypothetical protein
VKAGRYYGQGAIRVEDIPEPTPGPGQVQVAVDWCDGKVAADQFTTGRIGLDDIVEGEFRRLIDNEEENVKILVSPR